MHLTPIKLCVFALLAAFCAGALTSGPEAQAKPIGSSGGFAGWCAQVDKRKLNNKKRLSYKQLRCLAVKVGWRGKNTRIAAAIAMAESNGKVRAVELVHRNGRGLFQIDRRYWKVRKKCLFSATCNARIAYKRIFRMLGFGAWATYTHVRSGEKRYPYCKYLSRSFKRKHERRCL